MYDWVMDRFLSKHKNVQFLRLILSALKFWLAVYSDNEVQNIYRSHFAFFIFFIYYFLK